MMSFTFGKTKKPAAVRKFSAHKSKERINVRSHILRGVQYGDTHIGSVKNAIKYIHSQALIVQAGPLASLFRVS
jgi:hypothetical protein